VAFSDKLRMIGYWNDKLQDGNLLDDGFYSERYALYPSPLDLISPGWLSPEKSSLISYLRSGVTHKISLGWSTCRFLCKNQRVGGLELTDGVWVWPEGLAHYVEVHDVLLPSEFVDHARNNGFLIPADVIIDYERKWKKPNIFVRTFRFFNLDRWAWYRRSYDVSFWIQWGKNLANKGAESSEK
jgi:hypothetical protein